MDFAKFKASLDKSRECEVEVDEAKFRMRLPTEHAWRLAYELHKGTQAHARAVVEASLVGWSGVRARHFLVGAGDEAVDFSADAKVALLDERQDIGDELMVRLMEKVTERRSQVEAARKNSSREPSGT